MWHVAHCCLKSAAPSGGLAAGSGICAEAALTDVIALQNPSPMTRIARRFLIDRHRWREPSLGRRQQAVVVAGCFMTKQNKRGECAADAAARRLQSSKPPELRLALTSLRRFLPSSRRCLEPSVGRVARRGVGRTKLREAIAAIGRSRRRGCAPGYGNAAHGSRSRRPWSCGWPASRSSRAATSSASVIRRVSKRSCAALESLLTFCPPGPEARTKLISMSFSSIGRSREIRSMASPGARNRASRG